MKVLLITQGIQRKELEYRAADISAEDICQLAQPVYLYNVFKRSKVCRDRGIANRLFRSTFGNGRNIFSRPDIRFSDL